MLSSFTIRDFKSYRKATLPLAPLTVLIGANASGKSNLIEGLRLFSWIAQGNKLGAIRYAVQEQNQPIRGKVSDLGFRNSPSFSLACITDDSAWNKYSITLDVRDDDELHVADERLTGPGTAVPLFEVVDSQQSEGSIRVAYNNFARGGRKPQVACTDQMAVLLQLQSSARFEGSGTKAHRTIPSVATRYETLLTNIVFLDPQPASMRKYSFATEHTLNGNGANLSGVLFNLCRREETADELLKFVKALPEQDIRAMDFVVTPRSEVMVKLTETFGNSETEYDATLLSDGTLRVLAIAAAVLSAPQGSLVVIEEIDNGVHPSRAEQLLERIARVSADRDLRVLLSSHNPALLDALPNDAVADVVFCYRDPDDGSSRLTRLSDLADYPSLIAQGPVGHLLTRGIIERFAKRSAGPDVRKERAYSWLAKLREPAA